MNELLCAASYNDPTQHLTLEVTSVESFSAGGIERKHLLTAKLGERATSFIERPYSPHYVQAWRGFREANLPVPPELYRTSRNTILVADLKADGSELYGKSFLKSSSLTRPDFHRPSPEADEQFLQLDLKKVRKEAIGLAHYAASRQIRLANDDPLDLQVRTDGTWQLMAVDLAGAIVPENHHDNERFNNAAIPVRKFRENNLKYVRQFHEDLESIRERLSNQT